MSMHPVHAPSTCTCTSAPRTPLHTTAPHCAPLLFALVDGSQAVAGGASGSQAGAGESGSQASPSKAALETPAIHAPACMLGDTPVLEGATPSTPRPSQLSDGAAASRLTPRTFLFTTGASVYNALATSSMALEPIQSLIYELSSALLVGAEAAAMQAIRLASGLADAAVVDHKE